MPAYTDTTAYPVFTALTAKRELIREVLRLFDGQAGCEDLVYRINNTVTITDVATVYIPTDTFASS